MTPAQIREARHALGLTQSQLAAALEATPRNVRSWEAPAAASTHRPLPTRAARLIAAYLDGWRPADWPDKR